MDFMLLGEGKLKLTLSPDDMDAYDLRADALDWSDTRTRRAMWCIFDEVKRRCGFDAASSRVLVNVFPSVSGGCEIFVTRAGREKSDDVCFSGSMSAGRAYLFDGIDDLISCCRALCRAYGAPRAGAYLREDGKYLLLLEHDFALACEFGEAAGGPFPEPAFPGEHVRAICENDAVEVLARL